MSAYARVKRILTKDQRNIFNTKGKGTVTDIQPIRLDGQLAQVKSLMEGNSPFDPWNRENAGNLKVKRAKLIESVQRERRTRGLVPLRHRATSRMRGGRIFTSLKNINVEVKDPVVLA